MDNRDLYRIREELFNKIENEKTFSLRKMLMIIELGSLSLREGH